MNYAIWESWNLQPLNLACFDTNSKQEIMYTVRIKIYEGCYERLLVARLLLLLQKGPIDYVFHANVGHDIPFYVIIDYAE